MANSFRTVHGATQTRVKNILNQVREESCSMIPYSVQHTRNPDADVVPAARTKDTIREITFDVNDAQQSTTVQALITCAGHNLERCELMCSLELFLNFFKVYNTSIFRQAEQSLMECEIEIGQVSLEDYKAECVRLFGEQEVGRYNDFTANHARWVGGIIANFIGKYLSERNYRAWYENRTNGYCVKCDVAKDDPLLPFLHFSMSTCARMYEVISTKASLRRMLFFMFRTMVGRQNTKISKSLSVTMIMLKGSGMTGFMFITYFIANLHPILFGWNELGKYLPAYIAAANKYYSFGDGLGPYLKLILSEEETTEFKSDRLGVLQTVATAIAKAQGQKTAGNIRGNLEAADLPIVNQALEIVQAYGGANTVATDAVRQWDIDHLPNRHLIDEMGQGARAAELENIGALPEVHEPHANN